MLIFPIEELPVLPKGKGNKLISISTKAFKEKSEFMMDVCCLTEDSKLHIHHEGKTGGKTWTLKDLEDYISSLVIFLSKVPGGPIAVPDLDLMES